MKFCILIFLLPLFCSCRENGVKSDNIIPEKEGEIFFVSSLSQDLTTQNNTLYFNHKKFNGYLYSLSTTSRDTLSIESYSDGVLDGVSKKWYSNGQLMEWRYYSHGQKGGKQIAYFENGRKKFEFTAHKDQYEGELKEWNNEGRLIHLATFENGQEEGTQKMWYDNGKIRANYVMIKGKRYGLLGTKNCKNVSDSIFNFQ